MLLTVSVFNSCVMLSVVTVGGGGGGGGPILYPGCWWWWGWPTKAAPHHRHHRGSTPHIYKKLLVLVPPPDRGWSWVKVDTPSSEHRRRNPPRECDGVAAGILNFDIDRNTIRRRIFSEQVVSNLHAEHSNTSSLKLSTRRKDKLYIHNVINHKSWNSD